MKAGMLQLDLSEGLFSMYSYIFFP